jgi:hypothetical protein
MSNPTRSEKWKIELDSAREAIARLSELAISEDDAPAAYRLARQVSGELWGNIRSIETRLHTSESAAIRAVSPWDDEKVAILLDEDALVLRTTKVMDIASRYGWWTDENEG